MTIANMRTKIEKQRVMIITQAIFVVTIIINAISMIMLVQEKSYNAGYNDAYNTGQADGWQSCVEENNLYERYEHEQ